MMQSMRGALLFLCGVGAFGCGLTLDLSQPDPDPVDGAVGVDGGGRDAALPDGAILDGAMPDGASDGGVDASVDGGTCTSDADCMGRGRTFTETPCVEGDDWICGPEGSCIEPDVDGDGLGPGCPMPDCDDGSAAIGAVSIRGCTNPALSGACARGIESCSDGRWSGVCETTTEASDEYCDGRDNDCDGAVDDGIEPVAYPGATDTCGGAYACEGGRWVPTSRPSDALAMDGCGGGDEDCDGIVDEDCLPEPGDCVYVRGGSTESPDPTSPTGGVGTVRQALDLIRAGGVPPRICLLAANAAGSGECTDREFTVRDVIPQGVEIRGDLRVVGGEVLPCDGHSTFLQSSNAQGVELVSTGTIAAAGPTRLRDLVVRFPDLGGIPSYTGIVVRSSTRAVLENVAIDAAGFTFPLTNSVGLRVQSGAEVRLVQTRITPGPGRASGDGGNNGIVATDATLELVDACPRPGCELDCTGEDPAIVGGTNGFALRMVGGVLRADRYALCGGREGRGAVYADGGVGVEIVDSYVQAGPGNGTDMIGIKIDDCTGGRIFGTSVRMNMAAEASVNSIGVEFIGSECAGLLVSDDIVGARGGDLETGNHTGVLCAEGACLIDSTKILGASGGLQAEEVIGLESIGAETFVLRSVIQGSTDGQAVTALGVDVSEGGRTGFLANRIGGGCASDQAVGVALARGEHALATNEVIGALCLDGTAEGRAAGLAVEASSGVELQSVGNSYGAGALRECDTSWGALLATARGVGLFLNDVFAGGEGCSTSEALVYASGSPQLLAFDGFTQGPVDLSGTVYTDAGALLSRDGRFIGNLFTNAPGFADRPGSYAITAASPFADRGTSVGLDTDVVGRPRGVRYSIGAYEP